MLKIPKRASAVISMILTIIMLILTVLIAAFLPQIVNGFCSIRLITEPYSTRLLVILYVVLIPALIAEISLIVMLSRISKGKVFDDKTVEILRLISWCCFAEFALFMIIGLSYPLSIGARFPFSYFIAAAAVVIGMIVRVMKNVIEEAVDIKTENDFTI